MASSYLCFWKSSWFLFNREVCHAAKFQPNAWHAGFTLGQLCLCFLLWQSQCVLRCVKLGSNAGVLVPLIFFKELFNLGSLMPEYQHILSKIFKLIWLIVHLQHRGKMSQRFYFSYLNYCPTIRSKGKLTCFLKKKKALQHSFRTPTRPWGSSTSFLLAFFRSKCVFLTSGNKGCFVLLLRFVCVTDFRTLSRKCHYYLHRISRASFYKTFSEDCLFLYGFVVTSNHFPLGFKNNPNRTY